jgi:hypothetical protein
MSCSNDKQRRLEAAYARIATQPELATQLAEYMRVKGEIKARLNKGR